MTFHLPATSFSISQCQVTAQQCQRLQNAVSLDLNFQSVNILTLFRSFLIRTQLSQVKLNVRLCQIQWKKYIPSFLILTSCDLWGLEKDQDYYSSMPQTLPKCEHLEQVKR